MTIRQADRFRDAFARANTHQTARILSRYRWGYMRGVDFVGARLGRFTPIEHKVALGRMLWDEAWAASALTDRIQEMGEDPELYQPTTVNEQLFAELTSLDEPLDILVTLRTYLAHFGALCAIHLSANPDSSTQLVLERIQTNGQLHVRMLQQLADTMEATPEQRQQAAERAERIDRLLTEREEYELETVFRAP